MEIACCASVRAGMQLSFFIPRLHPEEFLSALGWFRALSVLAFL